MSFGSIIFTDKGRILQAKAQAGKQLNFTKIQIGDGQLGGAAIQSLNALISPKKNISITNIKTSTSTATVGGILNNSDIATGFYWREVGLFAADPDTGVETLYCYGNAGNLAEYIPAGGGSSILEKRLDIVATIGNATNISAAIDSSLIYLTLSDLDAHNNSGTAHPDIREQISDLSVDVQECFQSVSSGKQVVATAITGKGVPTSGDATFSQLANNIGQIQTQSILTGDAMVGDVLSGKTFYSTNPSTKLTGTLALTGTALAAHVLAGNYFYNTDAKTRILGTMVNRAAQNATLATNGQTYIIPVGYHNGAGVITAAISNLVAANVKAGATVGGIAGTFSNDANAAATDISFGKTAYVNGNKLTGTANKPYVYNEGDENAGITGGVRVEFKDTAGDIAVNDGSKYIMETTRGQYKTTCIQTASAVDLTAYASLIVRFKVVNLPRYVVLAARNAQGDPIDSGGAPIGAVALANTLSITLQKDVIYTLEVNIGSLIGFYYPSFYTICNDGFGEAKALLHVYSILLLK